MKIYISSWKSLYILFVYVWLCCLLAYAASCWAGVRLIFRSILICFDTKVAYRNQSHICYLKFMFGRHFVGSFLCYSLLYMFTIWTLCSGLFFCPLYVFWTLKFRFILLPFVWDICTVLLHPSFICPD